MKKIFQMTVTVREDEKENIQEVLNPFLVVPTFHEVRRHSIDSVIAMCILSMIFGVFLSLLIFGSYRDGQIDALSGKKVGYHLAIQPDSTKVWEKK